MKTVSIVLKILAALIAVAGIVYVVITYGDKIVAWTRNLLSRFGCCCCEDDCCCEGDCCCEEGDCCCVAAEEAPAQEAAVQAEDADFEG